VLHRELDIFIFYKNIIYVDSTHFCNLKKHYKENM